MRIALYFDLPGASPNEATKAVFKMASSMVNPTDNDVRVDAFFSNSVSALPNILLLPNSITLEGEDTRLQREKDCRTRCENAGWTMRDGQVFNALHHANLQSALDHPDATVYDSWAECCKGEGLTADLTADLGITEPGEKEAGFSLEEPWSGHAAVMRDKLRGHTAAESEGITTQTGIVTRSTNIQAGSGTSSDASFSGPAGWGGGGKASGGMAGAGSAEAPRLVPRMEPPTIHPDEDVPEGYQIRVGPEGWYFVNIPAGVGCGERFGTKEQAIEAAKNDDIRDIEDEAPAEPRDPKTVFMTAIDEALDHLMSDIPDWRKKFHPFVSTKGKRALEDLVGLVASIRSELKSEASSNITN